MAHRVLETLDEQQNTEKEQRWLEVEQVVERIVDKLGRGIDRGIRPVVVGLKVHGFGTTGSCEGHTDWGLPFPWVDVEGEYAERLYGSRRYQELGRKIRGARVESGIISENERREYDQLVSGIPELNAAKLRRLEILLAEYNLARSNSWPRLGIEVWSVVRRNRLQPTDVPHGSRARSEWIASFAQDERTRWLKAYGREMDDFARFLREKFLGG